jgi:hypothetical protein
MTREEIEEMKAEGGGWRIAKGTEQRGRAELPDMGKVLIGAVGGGRGPVSN